MPAARSRGLASIALRNAASTGLVRISTIVVGMILTPFVLHRLGRDLYGVVVATGSVFDYLSLMRGGMGSALRRYVTLHHHAGRLDEARRFYSVGSSWAGALRLLILVVGIGLALPICRFLRLPDAYLVDGAIGVALVIAAAVIADAGQMLEIPTYVTGHTHRLSNLRLVVSWLRIAVVVAAFHFFLPSLKVYGSALVVIEFIPIVVLVWMAQRSGVVDSAIPRPRFGDPALRRQLFQYGGFAILSQIANILYVSTDNLMIGRIYGTAAVTRYSLGTRWSPLILGFLVSAISSLTPLFTQLEAKGESDRSRNAMIRLVSVTAALAMPFCLVPCVVGDLFLTHWVGPEYRGSAAYLIAMLAPSVLEASLSPVWMLMVARGRIGAIAAGDIVVAIGNVGVSLLLALVFHLGLLGFALGNTIALLVRSLLLRPLVGRRDPGFPPIRQFLAPIPRAFAGALPGLGLLFLLRGVYGGSLATVIIAGVIGGVVTLIGSALAALGPGGVRSTLRIVMQARTLRSP
jgi:membrane protein EpsK